jgi:uncharacterized protein
MSLDMAQAALDAADRIGRWSRPSKALTLYGGEPFQCVNEPLVRFLHEKALSRGFRHFSVITNALELEKFADLLGPAPSFSFLQITLDGPPEVHDRRRFRHDGRGTFQQIAANIVLALTRGARVSVRINVDRDNAHELAPLRDYFLSQGWTGNPLFRAYCSPVHRGACGIRSSNHYASHLEMQAEVREALPASCDESPSSPFQVASFTHAIQKRIAVHLNQKGGLPHWKTAFCGSNLSMYVFDPFGDIYPCWEVIGHPEHKIGMYGIGALDLDTAALQQWHHRSVVGIMACRRCPYLFFCGGGCEAFAYQRTGRLDQPHCFNFPEHFQQAARHAYTDWVRRAPEARQAWGNR